MGLTPYKITLRRFIMAKKVIDVVLKETNWYYILDLLENRTSRVLYFMDGEGK